MAELWGGRFTKEAARDLREFNDSLRFDMRLYPDDIRGSMAHARMLAACGVISAEDESAILSGLQGILEELDKGELVIRPGDAEDIHSFVEAELTRRIGDAGKRLHTGRSRNDQVALDLRLYVRRHIDRIDEALYDLMQAILEIMVAHRGTVMPGFTHLQKAQPVTLAHHLDAYFEMFRRDRSRLADTRCRMNLSPLGSGALAGTTYPLDREMTAQLLDFDGPTRSSMDGVSDRDYAVELCSDLSLIMMHLSRFSEEIILWNSDEYRFIELDDAFSTGSSIMPQKKNPDIAELVRGKTGRVYGDLTTLLTLLKGIPLAYNKDLQEDKEAVFDAIDTVLICVRLFAEMLRTTRFNEARMKDSAAGGFTNATDAADYLVGRGMPFREAHGVIGRLVLYCQEKGRRIEELSLEEFRAISPVFDEGIFDAIKLENCVDRRNTAGGPGLAAMEETLREAAEYMKGSIPKGDRHE